MKFPSIKASKKKPRAKVIEWEERKGARGTRYVPVEVTPKASKSQRRLRQDTGRTENIEAALHKTTPPSMDIDETFWVEEPVMSEKKRVSSPAYPSSTIFNISLSPKPPTLRSLLLGLAPTCVASSILRVFLR
jgi:hypothetical protein